MTDNSQSKTPILDQYYKDQAAKDAAATGAPAVSNNPNPLGIYEPGQDMGPLRYSPEELDYWQKEYAKTGESIDANWLGNQQQLIYDYHMARPADSYWEEPSTLARWALLDQNLPKEAARPVWMQSDVLQGLYNYLSEQNGNKPWYEWEKLKTTDPVRILLQRMPLPDTGDMPDWEKKAQSIYGNLPPDILNAISSLPDPQKWGEQRALTSEQTAKIREINNFIENPTVEQGTDANGNPIEMVAGISKAEWDAMDLGQKAEYIAMSPTSPYAALVQAPAIGVGMGAVGSVLESVGLKALFSPQGLKNVIAGGAKGLIPGVAFGIAMTAAQQYRPMEALGADPAGVQAKGWFKDLLTSMGFRVAPDASWEDAAMELLNLPMNEIQKQIGWGVMNAADLGKMLRGEAPDTATFEKMVAPEDRDTPEKFKQQYELWKNARLEASRAFYQTDPFKNLTARGVEVRQPGSKEVTQWSPADPNSSVSEYVLDQIAIDIYHKLNAGEPLAPTELAYQPILQTLFGVGGQTSNLIAQVVLDPSDLIPKGISIVSSEASNIATSVIAGKTPNAKLSAAMLEAKGPYSGLKQYQADLKRTPVNEILDNYGWFERTLAGIDETGQRKDLNTVQKGNAISQFFGKLAGLTPESRVFEVVHTTYNSVLNMLDNFRRDTGADPEQMVQFIDRISAPTPEAAIRMAAQAETITVPMKVGGETVSTPLPRQFASPELQPALIALKDQEVKVHDLLSEWRSAEPARDLVRRAAAALEMDEHQVMATMLKGGTEARSLIDLATKKGMADAAGLEGAAKIFYDPTNKARKTAFSSEDFQADLSILLAEGAEKWAIGHFGVKEMGWMNKLNNLMKNAQGLVLFDYNPAYALNNGINNLVTLAWDGLLGSFRGPTYSRLLERFGRPSFTESGLTPAEYGTGQAEAGLGGRKGRAQSIGEEVRKTRWGTGRIADANEFVGGVRGKLGLFNRLSGWMERRTSQIAVATALDEMMGRKWRASADPKSGGYRKLPADLRADLNRIAPGLADKLEKAPARGLNVQEVEREIFSRWNQRSVKDVLSEGEYNLLSKFPAVLEGLETKLRTATDMRGVDQAIDETKTEFQDQVKERLAQSTRAMVEQGKADITVEGTQKILDKIDDVVPNLMEFWGKYQDAMGETAERARNAPTDEEADRIWFQSKREWNQNWRNFEVLQAGTWRGVFEGLGIRSMDAANPANKPYFDFMQSMQDLHDRHQAYFVVRDRELTRFFTAKKNKNITKRDLSNIWADVQRINNEEYIRMVADEDAIQAAADEAFVTQFDQERPESKGSAAQWRSAIRDVRRQMMLSEILYRGGSLPAGLVKEWGVTLRPEIVQEINSLTLNRAEWLIPGNERPGIQKGYADIRRRFLREMLDASNGNPPGKPVAPPPAPTMPPATPIVQTAQKTQPAAPGSAPSPIAEASPVPMTPAAQTGPTAPVLAAPGGIDAVTGLPHYDYAQPKPVAVVDLYDREGAALNQSERMNVLAQTIEAQGIGQAAWYGDGKLAVVVSDLDAARTALQNLADTQEGAFVFGLGARAVDAEIAAGRYKKINQPPERRAATREERLQWLATHDQLTRLWNKLAFDGDGGQIKGDWQERIELNQAMGLPAPVVSVLDVRGLHATNNEIGYDAGDAYLKAIGKAFTDEGLDGYRTGGDEFAAIFDDPAQAKEAMDRVIERINGAIIQVGEKYYVGSAAHYGTGGDFKTAYEGQLAAKRADPRAAEFERATYKLKPASESDLAAQGQPPDTARPGGTAGTDTTPGRTYGGTIEDLDAAERARVDAARASFAAGLNREQHFAKLSPQERVVRESEDFRQAAARLLDELSGGHPEKIKGGPILGSTNPEWYSLLYDSFKKNGQSLNKELLRDALQSIIDKTETEFYAARRNKALGDQYINEAERLVLGSLSENEPVQLWLSHRYRDAMLSFDAVNEQLKAAGLEPYDVLREMQAAGFGEEQANNFYNAYVAYLDGRDPLPGLTTEEAHGLVAGMRAADLVEVTASGEIRTPDDIEALIPEKQALEEKQPSREALRSAVRKAAHEAGFDYDDKHLIASVNKYLEIPEGRVTSVDDLTPEMIDAWVSARSKASKEAEEIKRIAIEQARILDENLEAIRAKYPDEARAHEIKDLLLDFYGDEDFAQASWEDFDLVTRNLAAVTGESVDALRERILASVGDIDLPAHLEQLAELPVQEGLTRRLDEARKALLEETWHDPVAKRFIERYEQEGYYRPTYTNDGNFELHRSEFPSFVGHEAAWEEFKLALSDLKWYEETGEIAASTMKSYRDLLNRRHSGEFLWQDSEGKAMVEKAVQRYGTTEDFGQAGYILPDGRLLNLRRAERDYLEHSGVAAHLLGRNKTSGNADIRDFQRQTNAIRMDASSPSAGNALIFLDMATRPTRAQMRAIENGIAYSPHNYFTIQYDTPGGGYGTFGTTKANALDDLNKMVRQRFDNALFQDRNGATFWDEQGRAHIRLMRDAKRDSNFSTWHHEFFHALLPLLPADMLKVFEKYLADEHGISNLPEGWQNGTKNAKAKEILARANERYLVEGKHVLNLPAQVVAVLDKIKIYMLKVYQQVTGHSIDVPLPDYLTEVFDRLRKEEEVKPVIPEKSFGRIKLGPNEFVDITASNSADWYGRYTEMLRGYSAKAAFAMDSSLSEASKKLHAAGVWNAYEQLNDLRNALLDSGIKRIAIPTDPRNMGLADTRQVAEPPLSPEPVATTATPEGQFNLIPETEGWQLQAQTAQAQKFNPAREDLQSSLFELPQPEGIKPKPAPTTTDLGPLFANQPEPEPSPWVKQAPVAEPAPDRQARLMTALTERIVSQQDLFKTSRDFEDFARSFGFDLDREADLNYAYDLLEGSFNLLTRRLRANMAGLPLVDRLTQLAALEKQLVKARRTLLKSELQQFSTPLTLSEAAGEAADVRPGDVIWEPTAGTGNLVNRFADDKSVSVRVNEIDPQRREVLKLIGFNPTDLDLLSPKWLIGSDKKLLKPNASVQITNPPWGAYSTGKYGQAMPHPIKGMNDWSQRFTYLMMERLAPGGRFVGVMPLNWMYTVDRSSRALNVKKSAFLTYLEENYNVRALIESPAGAYDQRATGVGSLLIVVDKTQNSLKDSNTRLYRWGESAPKDWAEYADLINQIQKRDPEEVKRGQNAARATGLFSDRSFVLPTKQQPTGPDAAGIADPAARRGERTGDPANIGKPIEQPARTEPPAEREPAGGLPVQRPDREAGSINPRPGNELSGIGERIGGQPGGRAADAEQLPTPPEGNNAPVVEGQTPGVPGPLEPGIPEPSGRPGGEQPAALTEDLGVRPVELAPVPAAEPSREDIDYQRKWQATIDAVESAGTFAGYVGRSQARLEAEGYPTHHHPSVVVETKALMGVPYPELEDAYRPTDGVMKAYQSGALSMEGQLDVVWAAIQQNDKHGMGMLVADDVGMGKSRSAAAFALDRIERGQKIVLVVTKNPGNVRNLMNNEFPAIFGEQKTRFVDLSGKNMPDVKNKKEIPIPTYDEPAVYFMSATEFASFGNKLKDLPVQSVIVDEAHTFKSVDDTKQGIFWTGLHEKWNADGVNFLYLTATPATDLMEMKYLYGLKLWTVDGFGDWLGVLTGKMSPEQAKTKAKVFNEAAAYQKQLTEAAAPVLTNVEPLFGGKELGYNFDDNLYYQEGRQKGTGKLIASDRYGSPVEIYSGDATMAAIIGQTLSDILQPGESGQISKYMVDYYKSQAMQAIDEKFPAPKIDKETRDALNTDASDALELLDKKGKKRFGAGRTAFESTLPPEHTEQIMREMKLGGSYMSRDIARNGVEFEAKEIKLTPEQKRRQDERIDFYRQVIAAYQKWGKLNKQKKMDFGVMGKIQDDAKRALFDYRLTQSLPEIDAAIARGEQVVIALVSVGEVDPLQGGHLRSAIDMINHEESHETGDGTYSDPADIPEAQEEKARLLEQAEKLGLGSPIKLLESKYGDRIGFVTGEVTDKARASAMTAFQRNKLDAIVISGAGKTGINLHDITGKRRMHLMVVDFDWSATEFKQELGRVDRTGQKSAPKVTVFHTGNAAELKFISTITNRMKGLGATSKGGSESTGTSALNEQFELGSTYDKEALNEMWRKLPRPDKLLFMDKYFYDNGQPKAELRQTAEAIKKFTMALQSISLDKANQLVKLWMDERAKFTELEAGAAAVKKQMSSGDVLRTTELGPNLTLTEARDATGHRFGVVSGVLTPQMNKLASAFGSTDSEFVNGEWRPKQWREWINFTNTTNNEKVSGLVIPPGKIETIAAMYGTSIKANRSIATALEDIKAGDKLPIVGADMNEWTLRLGTLGARKGKIVIEGARMAQKNPLMNNGARYDAVGSFFYVPEEKLQDFLHRFPLREETPPGALYQEAEAPSVPPGSRRMAANPADDIRAVMTGQAKLEDYGPNVQKFIQAGIAQFVSSYERKAGTPEWMEWFKPTYEAYKARQQPATPAVNAPLGTAESMSQPPTDTAQMMGYLSEVGPVLEKARGEFGKQRATPNSVMNLEQALPPETMKKVRGWAGGVYADLADTKYQAIQHAKMRRDAALLDYTKRTGFDNLLGAIFPYSFWYTHSMVNWAIRALERPSTLINYMRIRNLQNRQQKEANSPGRLEGKIELPFLSQALGGRFFVDPMRQIYPFEQMLRPFENFAADKNQAEKRAAQLITYQAENETITSAEAQTAITSKAGPLWERAYNQAELEIKDVQPGELSSQWQPGQSRDWVDLAFQVLSPSLPLSLGYNLATGRQMGSLPVQRFVQNVTSPFGIGGPRGFMLTRDKFDDYREDRELANMAGEGLISTDEAKRAMIDRVGPAFAQAQQRVAKTTSVQYWLSSLAADLYPEGEQHNRELHDEYLKALQQKVMGDKQALNKFYDEYPEYEARNASFDEPEPRLRQMLISQIWDKYGELNKLNQDAAQKQLGEKFGNAFVNKETRSYDSIDTQTLGFWAKTLGAKTPAKVAAPETPLQGVPAATSANYDAFTAAKAQAFPGLDALYKIYWTAKPGERTLIEKGHPEMQKYMSWKTQYLAQHPDLIPYEISETSSLYGAPAQVQQYVYQYWAGRDQRYPGIMDTQEKYFSFSDKAAKKAYLTAHPELSEYWDWRKQVAAQMPTAAPYIFSAETLAGMILGTSGSSGGSSGGKSAPQVDVPAQLRRVVVEHANAGTKLSLGIESETRALMAKVGVSGSMETFWRDMLPQIQPQEHPPVLSQDELAQIPPELTRQLTALKYGGKPLGAGGLAQVDALRKKLNIPTDAEGFLQVYLLPALQ